MSRRGTEGVRRVLMVVTDLTFGGAEAQVVRLAIAMRLRGIEVCVVSMLEPKVWLRDLKEHEVEVHSLRMTRGLPDPRAILRLRRIVKAFSPDVVHCHMFHANLLGRIARLVCSMPALICTVHNLRETSERGGSTVLKEILYRLTDAASSRTTIICKAAFDRYVRVGAVPQCRLEVVPNGVDVAAFSSSGEERIAARRTLGVERDFVWLAVGRLTQQKDYPNLFRAVAEMGGSGYVVLIAGGGPLEAELKAECARLGINERIRFLGTCENIRHLYSASDAYVMSSEFEGFSMALLEASCMSLPIVATDAGGNREIVQDGLSGQIVATGDSVRLAAAMAHVMQQSEEQRRQMGHAGRAFCMAHFDLGGVTDRWLDLYRRYTSRSRGSNAWKVVYPGRDPQEISE